MIDLKLLDSTNDITLADKDLVLTQSPGEILQQRLLVTFKTLVGEWYLNEEFGGYNLAFFTKKGITKERTDAYFLSIIRGFEEVEEVISFTSSFNKGSRQYSLTFNVKSIEGDGTFQINFNQADSLIQYPENTPLAEITSCGFVDAQQANDFYVLMNISIPTTIPWG